MGKKVELWPLLTAVWASPKNWSKKTILVPLWTWYNDVSVLVNVCICWLAYEFLATAAHLNQASKLSHAYRLCGNCHLSSLSVRRSCSASVRNLGLHWRALHFKYANGAVQFGAQLVVADKAFQAEEENSVVKKITLISSINQLINCLKSEWRFLSVA